MVLEKKLILLDLVEDVYKFYNIYVNSVGYNELQIIYHSGKLGTKGKRTMIMSNSYKEAMATAYSKFHEKKAEGFEEKEDMMGWLGQTNKEKEKDKFKKDQSKKMKKVTSSKDDVKSESKFHCDDCNKPIKSEVYHEINNWGRGGGGWDKDMNFVGYKKVLCIKCQWKYDIFKKRM